MNLRNPFKSLTWNSLRMRSRRRPRHVYRDFAQVCRVAEVLEVRSLLSGNVVAAVNGTALTLTSDGGDNDVDVFRLDATHIEIDGFNGTTINGAVSRTFALSSVFGITVNLGSGYDTYNIFSAFGSPALNIGAGGILFRGAAGGGTGDDLEVHNDSASPMTILGNVIERGQAAGSALVQTTSNSIFYVNTSAGALTIGGSIIGIESGDAQSDMEAFTYTGDLTVNGSISFTASGTSNNSKYSSVVSYGTGNVLVRGSVKQTASAGSFSSAYNYIYTNGAGNITIGLGATQTASAGFFSSAYNYIYTNDTGNIKLGLGATQTASAGGFSSAYNYIYTNDIGNIKIGLGATQTATAEVKSSAYNYVYTNASGFVAIGAGPVGGSLTQTASAGDDSTAYNYIYTNSDGNIAIRLRATQTASAGDNQSAYNYIYTNGAGNVTIGLGVAQTASAGDDSNAYNYIYTNDAGNVTITGLGVVQTASAGDLGFAYNYIYTGSDGNVTIRLGATQTASAGVKSFAYNYAYTDGAGFVAIGAGPLGGSLTQTASALDDSFAYNYAYSNTSAKLMIGNPFLGIAGGSLFQTASAGDGSFAYNYVYPASSGNVAIAGSVWQSAAADADSQAYNYVENDGSGNLTIGGGVRQTAKDTGENGFAYSYVITYKTGNIAIGFSVTQTATGDDQASNYVEADGDISTGGNIAIGGFVAQTATLTEFDDDDGELFNDVATFSFGNITIRGGVTQIGSSANYLENQVYSQTSYGGAIHIGGFIVMRSTTTGSTDFGSNNEVFADGGNVSALGVIINDAGSQPMQNLVYSVSGSNLQIGLGGVTMIGSGSAFHENEIYADPGATVRIAGSVVITDSTTGSGNQYLEIDGDTIIGGALLVTMNGPDATIHINDIGGYGTVEVKGLFHATMLGSNAFILVGDDEGSGASPVIFDSGVTLLGTSGAGATFEYDPANVTTPFITPVNFAVVVS